MKQILAITRKELEGYFGSLLALIFLGVFLGSVIFIFFNVEGFFARGLADVRPMFSWMPILLIFLLSALTMRQWSEEQRSGTMESLLTLPITSFQLVMGKFLAVMSMIVVALLMTLPIPVMVSRLGNLDWGPVAGGYLAALLMAAAYAAIGLFVSSRTDNQIVALIISVLVSGLFYLVGSRAVTDLVGGPTANVLWAFGTGSRFESIERGVIDLRDLIYYLSLCAIFLLLNVLSLDSIRWSRQQKSYRKNQLWTGSLLSINLLLLNVWVYPLHGLRMDLTEQKEFTISDTTRSILSNLQEPLLIRAYLSEQTHPLLTPLQPQIEDMLQEYALASNGKLQVDVVDPLKNPEIEQEANQTYGIQPTAFQINGQNEASIINAYFDILIRYGDQSVVLNLNDLIEVTNTAGGMDVQLKNLEYTLTSSIKKVVSGFQSVDSMLAALDQPVQLTLYLTQKILPDYEQPSVEAVEKVANEIQASSNGKFVFEIKDPDDAASGVTRQTLEDDYGMRPYNASLFSSDTYYFHMLLTNGDKTQLIYPPETANEADVRSSIESALKQTSTGFLKVVGLWTPSSVTYDMFGQPQQGLSSYNLVNQQLSQEYQVQPVDLTSGKVDSNIDVLVLIAPQNLTDIEKFAVDQFVMRGGALIAAAPSNIVEADYSSGSLVLNPAQGGISDLLSTYGINVSSQVVMDLQNAAFPVVVSRNVGGSTVQELQALDYPFFVNLRSANMSSDSMITTGLPALSADWSSAVELDQDKNAGRETQVLLNSSDQSWLTDDLNIQPDFDLYPDLGFAVGEDQTSHPLAVSVIGSFDSFYKGKTAPQADSDSTTDQNASAVPQTPVIDQSPANTRMVVLGSSGMFDDFALQLSSKLTQDYYQNNLKLLQNAVDWSVEDQDMLSIRSRGTSTRVLNTLTDQEKTNREIMIAGVEVVLLLAVFFYWQARRHEEEPMQLLPVHLDDKDIK